MIVSNMVRVKFYALRALALLLVISGGFTVLFSSLSFWASSWGYLAILGGVGLVRISDKYSRKAQGQLETLSTPRKVSAPAWVVTIASLVACGVFYHALYLDQIHGGNEVWPVYAFAVAVLALAASSGYVAMKLFQL